MQERPFDLAVLWLAALAALVVGCACMFGADWIRPPEEGAGPFLTPGRRHTFRVVALVAAAGCAVCLVRALWTRTGTPLSAAALMAVAVGIFAAAIWFPWPRVELRADGFDRPGFDVTTQGTLTYHNATAADLVLCLGLRGDCDPDAPGPASLRSPGLTVPANHRVSVRMPRRAGDFRVTIVNAGPGVTRRDMVLHTFVSSS